MAELGPMIILLFVVVFTAMCVRVDQSMWRVLVRETACMRIEYCSELSRTLLTLLTLLTL